MSMTSHGQNADISGGDSTASRSAPPAARNLRVLPQDISAAELDSVMKEYGEGLGVSCGYCHVKDPKTQHIDYVSDQNPRKQAARTMIAMLQYINTTYLSRIGDPRYPTLVTCGNCHQGQTHPPDFEQAH